MAVADEPEALGEPAPAPLFGSLEWVKDWKGPRSPVSGLPTEELDPCVPMGEEHDFAPELKYATSYGVVLFCKRCGIVAQAEIDPPPYEPPKAWWTKAADRLLKRAQNWAFCAAWRAGDLPEGKATAEPNHHRWPDRVKLGPIHCQRKGCDRLALVVRIYKHPWAVERIAAFDKVVPQ